MCLSLGGEKMASIIKKLNKQTGVTYVYESESYWDKEKKQPRSRRKLIGKIDDTTGEIIPTGGRGVKKRTRQFFPQMSPLTGNLQFSARSRHSSCIRMKQKSFP